MTTTTKNRLVVNLTTSAASDRSSVAFTVANAAISQGFEVAVFLSSEGVELSRNTACEFTHAQPLKPLAELIASFTERGGLVWACTPCFKHRGLKQDEIIDGSIVTGAGPMLEWIAMGATVISY
jgi:predicted peroxiredoxin